MMRGMDKQLLARIEAAVSVDWYLVMGQSNGCGNTGNRAQYITGPTNEPLSQGSYPLGLTLNPGVIPGVRDATPPATISNYGASGTFPLFPVVPIQEGRDWFDALQQENVIHGESIGTAFLKTLNALAGQGRVYGITVLNRDGYDINQNMGANPWLWFQKTVTYLFATFGAKLRIPAVIYIGGEADAGYGTTQTTASAGTALTLPLSGATLNVASTTGFTTSSGGSIAIDTNMGRALCTYTSASGGVFSGVTSFNASIYSGATIVPGALVNQANFAGSLAFGTASGLPGLFLLQTAMQSYIQSVLGGSHFVPMFVDQQYDIAGSSTHQYTAEWAYLAWLQGQASGVTNPLQLAGTKYHRPSSTVSPGVHVNSAAQQGMGELFGRAVNSVVYQGQAWTPLYPTSVSYSGSTTAVVTFNVPVGNLFGDFNLVRVSKISSTVNVWGVSYRDSGATITVSSVQITASNQLTITFSASPNANTNRMIGFGITADYYGSQDAVSGTRTNLRDQDTYVSQFGQPAYNFLVSSEIGF
jgi:hypothetical protein